MEFFAIIFIILFVVFMAYFKMIFASRTVNGYIPFIESIAPNFVIENNFFYSIYRIFAVISYGLFFLPLILLLQVIISASFAAIITAIIYGLFSISV